MKKLLFLLLFLVVISGCRETFIREIDFATPSKLAVSCFVKPGDTLIQVMVSRSLPVYTVDNNNANELSDAQVVLEGNGQTHNLIYQSINGRYTVSVSPGYIEERKTYTLKVTHQNETVQASTTVPSSYVPQGQVQTSYVLQTSMFGGGTDTVFGCQANFNAAPLPNAYYGISYQLVRRSGGVDYPGSFYSNQRFSINSLDFIKSTQAAQNMFARLNEQVPLDFRGNDQSYYFKVHILLCDYAFYEFNRTADLNFRSNGEFFTEPVPIYTNVEGGLGCFGSYIPYSLNSPEF